MKICGSICEYNPLHNGHIKHIQKTKELLNPDYLICVMSGNFVQRGETAILDKYSRAELAIKAGADLCIELPTVYAISNAETFAFGGVKLLNDLKVVNYLSFGSECGNLNVLNKLANFFLNEDENYKSLLNEQLQNGCSFPKAVTIALEKHFENDKSITKKDIEEIYNANNILAVEYLKSIIQTKSALSPVTILREKSENELSSAHSIRDCLNLNDLTPIKNSVPEYVFSRLEKLIDNNTLPSKDKLDLLIRQKVFSMTESELENIYDVSEGLHNRIKNALFEDNSAYLAENIKTKRYTLAKIKRILLNVLLGISKNTISKAKSSPSYAKLLAINEDKKELLSIIKANSNIDFIARKSDYENAKTKDYYEILQIDILANYIYSLVSKDYIYADDKLNGIKLVRGGK